MPPRLRRFLFGPPRDVQDPNIFRHISLIAFLAWVGLGADGLSSSSYGPEEAFKALGDAHYLAPALALATAFTVFVISYAYSRIIEHFPFGGGGYVVATRLLGPRFGVVSGSALLVDYVLTVTTSIASGADACFSFLPPEWQPFKLPIEFVVIGLLTLMNLRGVKESVTTLMPIFLVFLLTHTILIFGVIATRLTDFPAVSHEVSSGLEHGVATLGWLGIGALFLRAYSMGAGTYTGIEAVSNGLQIMREPKVATAKRTMVYMAVSLALTAGGITLGYLLVHASPVAGKTMNAVLTERFAGNFRIANLPMGHWFYVLTLASETALLFVAAQTGFIDGPRVMANMATDSWLPHRFAQLSDRLTMKQGVLVISSASVATLLYTRGQIGILVLMYSINVFLTFSLSETSMVRYWLRHRKHPKWVQHISIHVIGLTLCVSILLVNIYEKFEEGGWVTLAVTTALIALCFQIKRHYNLVRSKLRNLDEILGALPNIDSVKAPPIRPDQPTAVLLVGGYSGLGVHALLMIHRVFPNQFKNFVFASVGVIDSATFKGVQEVEEVRHETERSLKEYVEAAHRLGLAAAYRMSIGTEAVEEAVKLCLEIAKEFPRAVFFAGKLVFEEEKWYQRILHNETAYQLQRRLQFAGLNAMVLPVRVLENPKAAPIQDSKAA
jgi:amino acid transporter